MRVVERKIVGNGFAGGGAAIEAERLKGGDWEAVAVAGVADGVVAAGAGAAADSTVAAVGAGVVDSAVTAVVAVAVDCAG